MAAPENDAVIKERLLEQWNSYDLSFEERDTLLTSIQRMNLYPAIMTEMDAWESETGLYPDIEDHKFVEKLMRKQEFAENKQDSILQQMEEGVNPCDPDKEFELTRSQRFIGSSCHPSAPTSPPYCFMVSVLVKHVLRLRWPRTICVRILGAP